MSNTNYVTVVHNEQQADLVKQVAEQYEYTNNLELENVDKLVKSTMFENGLVIYFDENINGKKGIRYSGVPFLEENKDKYHDITVRPTLVELTAAETRIKFKKAREFNNLMKSPSNDKPVDELITEQSHYREAGIEPIDLMRENFTSEEFSGFLQGNVLKYMLRFKRKNGLEDLKKAKTYLSWLIDEMEKE